MSTRTVCFLAAFLLSCSARSASLENAQPGKVEITEQKGKLEIAVNGRHFADYVFEGYSRPFLFPIIGPNGAKMTRNWPLAAGENEEHDHPHHKSFWWGHGDMNGIDFWAEGKNSGKVVQKALTKVASGTVGTIASKNDYVDQEGKVICTDERTLRIYSTGEGQIFDFDVTVHASHGDLKFGDTKEGTMALRLAETMRLKGKVGQGHIVNSEGVRDQETWGKRAKWVDYYGPVEGKTVGIAMFDHPSNPRHPTWWHVRDYGLFAANPFGLHDFDKKEEGAGNLTVPAGKKITFKYRFYIHSGDEKQAKVARAF
ncbi:MAG TPA: PmoA family protein, partial [Verrucomicrobiae bacterium]|nr:PmoA family protein [Verrucomicrobiae bacterium]